MNARTVSVTIAVGVLAVLLIVYGSIAIYRGSWDLANANAARSYQLAQKNADRQSHLVQHNYNTQEGYQTAVTNDVQAAINDTAQESGSPDGAALRVEAINAGDNACFWALKLIPSALPVPPEMQRWITANCNAGTLKLSSPIRSGSGS